MSYESGNGSKLHLLGKSACRYDLPFRRYDRFVARCPNDAIKLGNFAGTEYSLDPRFFNIAKTLPMAGVVFCMTLCVFGHLILTDYVGQCPDGWNRQAAPGEEPVREVAECHADNCIGESR
jgi:hypothetical protein